MKLDISGWPSPADFSDFERALDQGRLFAAMRDGAWWRARRNGATKTWKRDPLRKEIPVKCGFKSCARVESYNFQPEHWRIAP